MSAELWCELEGLLPEVNVRSLQRSSDTQHDCGSEMLKSFVPFLKILESRYDRALSDNADELCRLAVDAYERGGTSTHYFRRLIDFEADSQVSCWAVDNLLEDYSFAWRQRHYRADGFKAHEWLVLRDKMANHEPGQFGLWSALCPSEMKMQCADGMRYLRSLVSRPNRTFRTILDEDESIRLTQWCSGVVAVPLSCWLVVKALAQQHVGEDELLLMDWEMARLGRIPDAGRKVLSLL